MPTWLPWLIAAIVFGSAAAWIYYNRFRGKG